jgi:hypothetical protein
MPCGWWTLDDYGFLLILACTWHGAIAGLFVPKALPWPQLGTDDAPPCLYVRQSPPLLSLT